MPVRSTKLELHEYFQKITCVLLERKGFLRHFSLVLQSLASKTNIIMQGCFHHPIYFC